MREKIDDSTERRRESMRLHGYDYSQAGAYFITICTHQRACLFGQIVKANEIAHVQTCHRCDPAPIRYDIALNGAGRIIADEWKRSAAIRGELELDEWVVMPNHLHGIVFIDRGRHGTDTKEPPPLPVANTCAPVGPHPKSIGAMVAGFKSAATARINKMRNTPGAKLWQRNYWEHIIRNESELNRLREYIRYNPAQWESDELHSAS